METQFKIGDKVWIMCNNKPNQAEVERIVITRFSVEYSLSPEGLVSQVDKDSAEVFTTKEALIQSL